MYSPEPTTPQPPYAPGDRVTWTEQRRKGNSLTLTTRTGTVRACTLTSATVATDRGRAREVPCQRLRPLAQKTELQENVEAVFAAFRNS